MNISTSLFIVITAVLLSACSPHPGSGVWKAISENDYGIDKLIVSYDGKAHFTSTKINNAEWHCFWTASKKTEIEMECTPSTNHDREKLYTLSVDEMGIAQLKDNRHFIASFIRQDENPVQKKQ